MEEILKKHSQLSPDEQTLAEILLYAYVSDKLKGIQISKGRIKDLQGNKKVLYQIEVEE